ncbi:metal-dependent transcriptional regulator, partial [Candidatus Bathyarchaeota archaeon]
MIHLKKETSRLEDYLEAIYRLSHDKGYASTVDLSDMLNVKPPTVSGMVGNLANKGYLVHEPYRGMKLT